MLLSTTLKGEKESPKCITNAEQVDVNTVLQLFL